MRANLLCLRLALPMGLVFGLSAWAAAQQPIQKEIDRAPPIQEQRTQQRALERAAEPGREARDEQSTSARLTNYFADQLMLANQAEIELGKIAVERSSNEQVKQFAESLIQDHTQLDQQLKQLAPEAAARFAQRLRAAAERLAARLPAGDERPAQTRTAGRDIAEHDVLTKLCMINHRACANHREMCKQMLEKHQGQDFDMAYLGTQIGQHAWLLAELKALDGVGTPEFQAVVAQTREKVDQHLQHAKALAKNLEDDRRVPRDS